MAVDGLGGFGCSEGLLDWNIAWAEAFGGKKEIFASL